MRQKKKPETILYDDPLRDDFAKTRIRTKEVGADFPYVRSSLLWRFFSALVYYCVAIPIIFLISKVYLGLRVEGREYLKKLPRSGFFLYCNHTRHLDVFLAPLAAFPRRVYTVAGPDAVSIPGLRQLVMMLGCLPIPAKLSALPKLRQAIVRRYEENSCIAIFPEAHIWPFYTGIRPFGSSSFTYPAELLAPALPMAVTYYQRRGLFRLCKKPGMLVHVGDPVFPDKSDNVRTRRDFLRDQVYCWMCKTVSENENVEYIRYAYREPSSKQPKTEETAKDSDKI